MTTSLKKLTDFTNVERRDHLSRSDFAYFRALNRRNIHSAILERFIELSDDERITKADIARLLGVSRSQVTRWLSQPSNMRLDSLSDLMLALSCHGDFKVLDNSTDVRGDIKSTPTSTLSIIDGYDRSTTSGSAEVAYMKVA